MISIRAEEVRDYAAVRALNLAAFENGPEADLVETLRACCPGHIALVAVDEALVVGHILFTPVVMKFRDEFDTAM